MASGDEFKFQGTFRKVNEAAQQAFDELTQLAADARARGDEIRAGVYEDQAALARENLSRTGGRGGVSTAPEIEAANAARERAVQLDREDAAALAAQRDAILEQAALLREMRGGGRATPAVEPLNPLLAAASRVQGAQPDAIAAAEAQRQLDAQVTAAIEQQRLLRDLQARRASPEGMATGAASVARQSTEGQAQALREQRAAEQAILDTEARQAEVEAQRLDRLRRQTAEIIRQHEAAAYGLGVTAAAAGRAAPPKQLDALAEMPAGLDAGVWDKAAQASIRYNATLGAYDTLAADASIQTEALTNNLTRMGIADAEASTQLRKHGALTTEFLGALARGETTMSEFGYQIGATIGKFAGWTAAAAATYGALGAVVEFGKGALDAQSAVERLSRTIDNVNPNEANAKMQQLSRDTNVSMKEAGDAVFQFSRTFHNVDEATAAAHLGLAALKLDNVSLSDSVRASTAITQQFGGGLGSLTNVYNELSAAQREYNARISDMIPLLQKSSGAVANAGGDLTQLIQLGTYATRITQLSGAQIGTALYRGAATFLNPSTTKGATDIETLKGLGIHVTGNFTETLINAIRQSWALPANERSQIANAIFGPQYGGRLSAIFNPSGAALLNQIAGPGRGGINPQATRGSLNEELSRELGTAGERLHAFVNELQRIGAALGDAGVINVFTTGVSGLVDVLDEVRKAITAFDTLPPSLKEATAAALAFRLAMLAVSRTRIGATTPLLSRIPGFRPSEATLARGELTRGGRQAIDLVKENIQKTNTALLTVAAQQSEVSIRKADIDKRIEETGATDERTLQRSVELGLQIKALGDKQVALERDRADQQDQLIGLQKQQVGLGATRFSPRRFDDPTTLALRQATMSDAEMAAAAEAAAAEDAAAQGTLSRARARLALALGLDTKATRQLQVSMAESGAAASENAAASAGAAASSGAAAGEEAVGLGARIGTFVSAIDPLTAALVALPLAFEALSHSSGNTDKALEQAIKAAKTPVTNLNQLNQNIKDLNKIQEQRAKDQAKVANEMQKLKSEGGLGNDFNKLKSVLSAPSDALMRLLDQAGGVYTPPKPPPVNTQIAAATERTFANAYNPLFKQAQFDATQVGHTQKQRELWYHYLDLIKNQAMQFAADQGAGTLVNIGGVRTLVANQGKKAEDGMRAYHAFLNTLQQLYERIEKTVPVTSGAADPLAGFEKLDNKTLAARVQQADSYTKAFGADSSRSIQEAVYAYTALAQKLGAGGLNDADLTKLGTAQQNLLSTITTTTGKLLKNAQDAPTAQGQANDLGQATALIDQVRRSTQRALDAAIAEDKGNTQAIRRARANADVIFNALNNQLATVAQQADTLIQDQSTLAQSQVTGSSPEADISRQQVALSYLQRELSAAKSNHGTYDQISKLQAQVNSAWNALTQARQSNMRAILAAQGGLAQAQVTGLTPQDQINAARQAVTTARQLLSFDRAHNAGQAAILTDEKDLIDAQNGLNQALQSAAQQAASEAQALNSALASLAESKTLDPIKQAADAIRADTQNLGTIRRGDYTSAKAYETALANAQAQRNKDIQAKRDAIVNQDMQTLAYEYNTTQIGSQQYINGLEQILRTQKLSLQQRQQIEEQIYQLKTTQGQNLDLNVGSIKLPSIYEIRRAIGLGQRGELPGSGVTINHQASVVVNVYSGKDVSAVGAAIDQHLNTSVRSAMRAKGVVGV